MSHHLSAIGTRLDNTQDMINSHEVELRIDELKEELEALLEKIAENRDMKKVHDLKMEIFAWNDKEALELGALRKLATEARDYAHQRWAAGAELIRDSYFKEYAKRYAEEGHLGSDMHRDWPYNCIDWDAAADELKLNFTPIDFDGVTYYWMD